MYSKDSPVRLYQEFNTARHRKTKKEPCKTTYIVVSNLISQLLMQGLSSQILMQAKPANKCDLIYLYAYNVKCRNKHDVYSNLFISLQAHCFWSGRGVNWEACSCFLSVLESKNCCIEGSAACSVVGCAQENYKSHTWMANTWEGDYQRSEKSEHMSHASGRKSYWT